MTKKTIALFLLLAMVLGMVGCASAAGGAFSDVDSKADYAAAVDWCYQEGLMKGVGNGRFDPDGTLTRAMLVTTLYRAEGEPAVSGKPAFADTQADVWYSDAVVWASGEGVVRGYGNGLFGTDEPVSVEQLSVILDRYMGRGDTWTGDPARAHAATRAQVAVALMENLKAPGPELSPAPGDRGGVLVAYFSCTSNTKGVAEKIAQAAGGDLYEITPAVPYTSADLNYNSDCRANREQNDPNARPAISGSVDHWEDYDVVFLGYPIWWGVPPKIMHTFMESYDFSGKTVIPFCTSGSSSYNDAAIKALAPAATWLTGRRFSGSADQAAVQAWVDSLNLNVGKEESAVNKLYVSFNGHTYTATLAENSTVDAFVQHIRDNGGSVTLSASDYGGWEKVAPLGSSLPANNAQTTASAGDFVLYSGDQIVLFYGSNSWSYTRLGRLDGDLSHLKADLGNGDVSITYALRAEEPAP